MVQNIITPTEYEIEIDRAIRERVGEITEEQNKRYKQVMSKIGNIKATEGAMMTRASIALDVRFILDGPSMDDISSGSIGGDPNTKARPKRTRGGGR